MPPNDLRNTARKRALDRIDRQILGHLRNNARLSNKELAARVGLAPSSCLNRVDRLVADGVIRGFHTDLDPKSLGIGIQALVTVRLASHTRSSMDRAYEEIAARQEVLAVYRLAGADDLMLHVAVRDVDHLRELTLQRLSERPEVENFQTALIYEYRRAPGLPDLLDDAD